MHRSDPPADLASLESAKILVFSDSHGTTDFLLRCVRDHADANLIIHLGDHCDLLAPLAARCPVPLLGVAGNCDGWAGRHLAQQHLLAVAGHRLFITHGHLYGVKQKLDKLLAAGAGEPYNADIILFGHTHHAIERPALHDGREVLLLNPGSCFTGRPGLLASALILRLKSGQIETDFLLDLP